MWYYTAFCNNERSKFYCYAVLRTMLASFEMLFWSIICEIICVTGWFVEKVELLLTHILYGQSEYLHTTTSFVLSIICNTEIKFILKNHLSIRYDPPLDSLQQHHVLLKLRPRELQKFNKDQKRKPTKKSSLFTIWHNSHSLSQLSYSWNHTNPPKLIYSSWYYRSFPISQKLEISKFKNITTGMGFFPFTMVWIMSITYVWLFSLLFFSFKGIATSHFVAFTCFLWSKELEHIFTHTEKKAGKQHPGYNLYNFNLPLSATRKEETAGKYHRSAKINLFLQNTFGSESDCKIFYSIFLHNDSSGVTL